MAISKKAPGSASGRAEIVLSEASALLTSEKLILADPKTLTDAEAVTAWSILDAMEKEIVKTRKEELRQSLFVMAEKKGLKGETGSYVYALPGSTAKVTKQFNKGKVTVTDPVGIKASSLAPTVQMKVLRREISLSDEEFSGLLHCMSLVPEGTPMRQEIINRASLSPTRVDPDALEACYKLGLITDKQMGEVAKAEPPTYTLKVVKPAEVTQLLERSLNGKGCE